MALLIELIRSSMAAATIKDDSTVLIFGASGDVTARRLVPALFQL
jgi:glucose-6-phosphate 1-dehydrogenase